MPAAIEYLPDDKDQRRLAEEELATRGAQHTVNLKYYRGQHKEHLKVDKGYNPNVTVNLCRQAVDRTVSFLVPEFPVLDVQQGTIAEDEAIEAGETGQTDLDRILKTVWMQQGGAVKLSNFAYNGSVDGHCYGRVWLEDGLVQIAVLNGGQVLTWWDAHDRRNALWYELHWSAGKVLYRQDVLPEGSGNAWIIREYQKRGSKWELFDESLWDWPLSPIVDWPHIVDPFGYYGQHEFQDATLNDAVNKVATDINQILRFHAAPRTVGTGVDAAGIVPTAIDNFWAIPDKDAKIQNLEMQSDLAASLKFMDALTEAFFASGRVVMLNADLAAFRSMTNLAVRAVYKNQMDKNSQLQRTYGRGVAQLSARILMLLDEDPMEPEVIWPDALPTDRRETIQTIQTERNMGIVSRETASNDLGRDYALEQVRLDNEALIDDVVLAGGGNGAVR